VPVDVQETDRVLMGGDMMVGQALHQLACLPSFGELTEPSADVGHFRGPVKSEDAAKICGHYPGRPLSPGFVEQCEQHRGHQHAA